MGAVSALSMLKGSRAYSLNRSSRPGDMDLPGFRLHRLKGRFARYWSVTISANWRIIFRFEDGDAVDVDYLDYH